MAYFVRKRFPNIDPWWGPQEPPSSAIAFPSPDFLFGHPSPGTNNPYSGKGYFNRGYPSAPLVRMFGWRHRRHWREEKVVWRSDWVWVSSFSVSCSWFRILILPVVCFFVLCFFFILFSVRGGFVGELYFGVLIFYSNVNFMVISRWSIADVLGMWKAWWCVFIKN